MKQLYALRKRIEKRLKENFHNNDDIVIVSVNPLRRIHIVVVSKQFVALDLEERDEKVWPILEAYLKPDQLQRIAMCMLLTPQEATKIMPDLIIENLESDSIESRPITQVEV